MKYGINSSKLMKFKINDEEHNVGLLLYENTCLNLFSVRVSSNSKFEISNDDLIYAIYSNIKADEKEISDFMISDLFRTRRSLMININIKLLDAFNEFYKSLNTCIMYDDKILTKNQALSLRNIKVLNKNVALIVLRLKLSNLSNIHIFMNGILIRSCNDITISPSNYTIISLII